MQAINIHLAREIPTCLICSQANARGLLPCISFAGLARLCVCAFRNKKIWVLFALSFIRINRLIDDWRSSISRPEGLSEQNCLLALQHLRPALCRLSCSLPAPQQILCRTQTRWLSWQSTAIVPNRKCFLYVI